MLPKQQKVIAKALLAVGGYNLRDIQGDGIFT